MISSFAETDVRTSGTGRQVPDGTSLRSERRAGGRAVPVFLLF